MKIHVSSGSSKRKKYEFGDRREIGGVTHIRCRIKSEGCYVVSNGRYLVDWVPEDQVDHQALWPVRRK